MDSDILNEIENLKKDLDKLKVEVSTLDIMIRTIVKILKKGSKVDQSFVERPIHWNAD